MTDRSIMTAIYTDGACKGNPGPGGWGVHIQDDRPGGKHLQLWGGEANTTNNRMELMAALEAVRWYAKSELRQIVFYLDSEYVRKGTTEWMWGWKAKGWMTTAREPVKNADLWKEMDRLLSDLGKPIDWRWVKGHAGNPGNEAADMLANRGAAEQRGLQRDQEQAQANGKKRAKLSAQDVKDVICKHLPGAGRYPDRLDAIVKELGL